MYLLLLDKFYSEQTGQLSRRRLQKLCKPMSCLSVPVRGRMLALVTLLLKQRKPTYQFLKKKYRHSSYSPEVRTYLIDGYIG